MPEVVRKSEIVALPRFDENWESYDETDLAIIRNNAHLFQQDATEFGGNSLFFARQLDYVKARTYNRLFPAMNADLLVPDATDTPEWAESISIQSYDNVGMAKIIANYADDLPRADVRGMMQIVPVKSLGDSFGYNIFELRASRATGAGLDTKKAEAARRAIELKIAKIKMIGDADYGLFGLFNQPNIPEVILPNPGPWDVPAMTGDMIYANLIAMTFAYTMQNMGTHTANTLALTPAAYNAAATKLFTTNTPITALSLFLQMNPGINVLNVFECIGADLTVPATPRDVALLYELSVDNLAHEAVMPFTQLPPEARNLEIVTDCIARSGGVHIYYPLSLIKALTS